MPSFELHADQQAAVREMAADTGPGAVLQGEIGSGKTVVGVETILERYATRSLIVAPLAVMESWAAAVEDRTDGVARLRVAAKKKEAGIPATETVSNLENYFAGRPGIYFMGREFWIAQDWETSDKVDARGRKRRVRKDVYAKRPVDVLLFDEAHFAASKQSAGFKTFKYAKAQYKIAATGTFFGSKFENAYTLPNAIWREELTDTYALWRERWCTTEYDHWAFDKLKVTAEAEPGAWVKAIPTYIFMEGHKGEVFTEERHVDLYPSQRRMYTALEKEYAAKAVSGEWILTELAAEAHVRLRQVSLATIDTRPKLKADGVTPVLDKHGRPKWEVFYPDDADSAYYDELKRELDKHEDPVVISSDFATFAMYLVKRLNRDGISAGLWAGKEHVKDEDRMALKASFMARETRIIVGVPAAMGTGVDGLQTVCHRLHIASEDQWETSRSQLIGRLNRKGQEQPVNVTLIHGRGTKDEEISAGLAMTTIANEMSRLDTLKHRA